MLCGNHRKLIEMNMNLVNLSVKSFTFKTVAAVLRCWHWHGLVIILEQWVIDCLCMLYVNHKLIQWCISLWCKHCNCRDSSARWTDDNFCGHCSYLIDYWILVAFLKISQRFILFIIQARIHCITMLLHLT